MSKRINISTGNIIEQAKNKIKYCQNFVGFVSFQARFYRNIYIIRRITLVRLILTFI